LMHSGGDLLPFLSPTRLQIVLFHMRRGRSFGASTSPPCATLGQSRTRNRKSKFYIRVFRRLDSEPTSFDVRSVISPKPSDDTRAGGYTWDAQIWQIPLGLAKMVMEDQWRDPKKDSAYEVYACGWMLLSFGRYS
jgi:hypothetical protein